MQLAEVIEDCLSTPLVSSLSIMDTAQILLVKVAIAVQVLLNEFAELDADVDHIGDEADVVGAFVVDQAKLKHSV